MVGNISAANKLVSSEWQAVYVEIYVVNIEGFTSCIVAWLINLCTHRYNILTDKSQHNMLENIDTFSEEEYGGARWYYK